MASVIEELGLPGHRQISRRVRHQRRPDGAQAGFGAFALVLIAAGLLGTVEVVEALGEDEGAAPEEPQALASRQELEMRGLTLRIRETHMLYRRR